MGAAAVVVGVSLVIILVITAVLTLVWRKRILRRGDETPKDRYQRAARDLRQSGGGIHPGGQPYVPPPPSNHPTSWG
jgi:hypothetical protein